MQSLTSTGRVRDRQDTALRGLRRPSESGPTDRPPPPPTTSPPRGPSGQWRWELAQLDYYCYYYYYYYYYYY